MARRISTRTDTFTNQITSWNSDALLIDGADSVGAILNITSTSTSAVVCASATDVTNATDLFTKAHTFTLGEKVQVTTSNTLPVGLSLATDYFVVPVVEGVSFKVATSLANALAGTVVNITSDGIGDQTFTPVALAGATYVVQVSPTDASLAAGVWCQLATPTSITATTTALPITTTNMLTVVGHKYLRYAFVMTAGKLQVTCYTNANNSAEK